MKIKDLLRNRENIAVDIRSNEYDNSLTFNHSNSKKTSEIPEFTLLANVQKCCFMSTDKVIAWIA